MIPDKMIRKQLMIGMRHGLSLDEIQLITSEKYSDPRQIEEIRLGFEHGLFVEQVAVYARPCFDYLQMTQIREGFEQGLTFKEIYTYADPDIDWGWMYSILWNILDEREKKYDAQRKNERIKY